MGQTILEINGIRYDASTGRVVEPASAPVVATPIQPSRGAVMDLAPNKAPSKPAVHHRSQIVKPMRQTVDGVRPHRTAKSKTLMRHVVKKPQSQTMPASASATPKLAHSSSYQSHQHAHTRTMHAMSTPKHAAITRFSSQPVSAPKATVTHMPVAPAPSLAATPTVAVQTHKPTQNLREQFVDSQLAKAPMSAPDTSHPEHKRHKRVKSKKRKLASISAGAMVFVAVAGLIVYLNLPTINVALAGREAGISARIPKGIPSNFALDNSIERSNGRVTLTFNSRSDDRTISLSQQQVDTTASSLSSELVEQSGRPHQVYEVGGLTLYMTGDGTADWIDGGMRYTIDGNTGLSSEQIATIARSL